VAYGIGGGGFIGIAVESTPGTYLAPTVFIPILSENLTRPQATVWRRPIRQNVDVLGGVPGNVHVTGDIVMEAFSDKSVYFHLASRASVVKTGSASPWTYTWTPTPDAIASKTLSITVVRSGEVFGYTGCTVGGFNYTVEEGQLKATYNIIGRDEASQTLPVPAWTGGQTQPFGAGEYTVEIPTATQVFDADTFTFTVTDNAEPQFRLKNTGRGAQFVKFGERAVNLTTERDFLTRTEYDAFKALTAQGIKILAAKSANESIQIEIPAAIKDTYELGLAGQGDLIRASINYMGTYDATATAAYKLIMKATVDITVV
jgi:hypothetical protein